MLDYAEIEEFPLDGFVAGASSTIVRRLPYRYILLRGEGHTVMVDVGYDGRSVSGKKYADASGSVHWQDPRDVLAQVNVSPSDVDTVIITHAHFDHFGNAGAFPNATFYVQEREITQWLWAMSLPKRFGHLMVATDPEDILVAVSLLKEGRLQFVRGDVTDFLPGIDLVAAFDSHTFGSMWLRVRMSDNAHDDYILAGDCVSVYENLQGLEEDGTMRALALAQNNVSCFLSMSKMLDFCDIERILPTHEHRLQELYPSRRWSGSLAIIEVTQRPADSRK